MRQVSDEQARIVAFALVGGGPLDGAVVQCSSTRTLMTVPLILDDTVEHVKYSRRWLHAYVRLDDGVFVYDGIREGKDGAPDG
jgi:hypothetical protein